MNIKNKKYLGILVVFLGVLCLGYLIISIVSMGKNETNDNAAISSDEIEDTAIISGDGEENEVPDPSPLESEALSFNNITSIFKYELHPEIEELLNAEKFDKELTDSIKNRNLITDASFENASGVYLVKSIRYLTKDLERDIFLFDLEINNEAKTIVSVSVSSDGEYIFDIK